MTEPTIPQNIEMEMALLGGIIATNKAYEKVAEYLQPIHFSQQVNGDIYAACSKMIEAGQLADRRTLEVHFGRDRGLAELGGPAYLDKLLSRAATLVETGAYGKDIYDIYLRREIIALGTRMANQAHPYEGEGVRQIERIEQDLYELATNGNYEGGFLPFNETIDYVMKMVEVHRSRDGALSGVSTGLNDLDAVLGGLHSSELVILAGRASTGAALATTIAYEAAEAHHKTDGEQGAVVGYFSLEMSAERLATRIISNQAKIPQEKLYRLFVFFGG